MNTQKNHVLVNFAFLKITAIQLLDILISFSITVKASMSILKMTKMSVIFSRDGMNKSELTNFLINVTHNGN